MEVTTGIYLDQRRVKANGKYPVKISVTYQRKTKYYSSGVDANENEFQELLLPKPKPQLKNIATFIQARIATYRSVISKLPEFSFETLEVIMADMDIKIGIPKKTITKPVIKPALETLSVIDIISPENKGEESIVKWFDKVIKEYDEVEQIKTGEGYDHMKKLLIRYFNSVVIPFSLFTPHELKKIEHWMLTKPVSARKKPYAITSVAIYMRYLKHVFNVALEDKEQKVIDKDCYPFGPKKYVIPTGKGRKIALTREEILAISNFETTKKQEQKARDFWLISLLCNGANMKDLLSLRWSNVQQNTIVFVRAKTKRKSAEEKQITVYISNMLNDLVSRWAKTQRKPNDYIFECFEDTMTAKVRKEKLNQFTKQINKYLKQIAKKLGIHKKVTTYGARHSFASQLRQAGIDIRMIQESLGHSKITTTESYMTTIENNEKRQVSTTIVNILKPDLNTRLHE